MWPGVGGWGGDGAPKQSPELRSLGQVLHVPHEVLKRVLPSFCLSLIAYKCSSEVLSSAQRG